jgi:hypothetical protein
MYKLKKTRKTRKVNRKNNIKISGGQLPPAPVGIVKLPPLSSLENMYENPRKSLIQKGGLLPQGYVGPTWGTLEISNFLISDQSISDFKRLSSKPHTDCVISALQIIGILDFFTANVLRITKIAPGSGIYENEIELIFSLRTNKRFLFMPTTDVNEFAQYVKKHLQPGNVVFCGVTYTNGQKHVFLIGKDLNGNLIKIDPQVPYPLCFLESDDECYRNFAENTSKYWLLFNYTGEMTLHEAYALGILLDPTFVQSTPL